ncbi:MAG: LPS assembly lipoprotein LptE [Sedimenticola sp.]
MLGKRPVQLALILITALLLQACGFQLRGEVQLPSSISPVHIQGLGTYHDLRIELTHLMSTNAVTITDSPEGAASTLHIEKYEQNRRTLSVDSNGNAAEYELYQGATFSMADSDGNELVAKQTVGVIQDYINTGTLVLGKQQEESTLRREMQRDLAGRIVRRLQNQLR